MTEIALISDAIGKLDLLANITETLLIGVRYKAAERLLSLLLNDPLLDLLHFIGQVPVGKEKFHIVHALPMEANSTQHNTTQHNTTQHNTTVRQPATDYCVVNETFTNNPVDFY